MLHKNINPQWDFTHPGNTRLKSKHIYVALHPYPGNTRLKSKDIYVALHPSFIGFTVELVLFTVTLTLGVKSYYDQANCRFLFTLL